MNIYNIEIATASSTQISILEWNSNIEQQTSHDKKWFPIRDIHGAVQNQCKPLRWKQSIHYPCACDSKKHSIGFKPKGDKLHIFRKKKTQNFVGLSLLKLQMLIQLPTLVSWKWRGWDKNNVRFRSQFLMVWVIENLAKHFRVVQWFVEYTKWVLFPLQSPQWFLTAACCSMLGAPNVFYTYYPNVPDIIQRTAESKQSCSHGRTKALE